MKKFLFAAWSALLLLASAPASAIFLVQGQLDAAKILSGPPASGSDSLKSDVAAIADWQKKRTSADCARAMRAEHVRLDNTFGLPDGPLQKPELAALEPFFHEVYADADSIILEAKRHWERKRPFAALPGVKPCIDLKTVNANYSYPSGHAALSRLYARILGEIDPSRLQQFLSRAEEVAEDRVRVGVHFPSDIQAGKTLAEAIFRSLMESEPFKARLAEIRASWKKAALSRK